MPSTVLTDSLGNPITANGQFIYVIVLVGFLPATRVFLSDAPPRKYVTDVAPRSFKAEAITRRFAVGFEIRLFAAETQLRDWEASDDMIHTSLDPLANENFMVDYTGPTANGTDAIASSAWIVPNGIVLGATSNTGTTATGRLSSAARYLGQTFQVTNTVTLTSGQVKVQNFSIDIRYQ